MQHCSAAPPQSKQKYFKIVQIPGFLMVWENAWVGGMPQCLFWGQRIQRKLEFLSKILYRQVHWCAALFCRTSPVQAKIPQNRPDFRVFDISGQIWGMRTPPPYSGAVETRKKGGFPRKTTFCRLFQFLEKTAAKITGRLLDPLASACAFTASLSCCFPVTRRPLGLTRRQDL